jgi:hypothetical protein
MKSSSRGGHGHLAAPAPPVSATGHRTPPRPHSQTRSGAATQAKPTTATAPPTPAGLHLIFSHHLT